MRLRLRVLLSAMMFFQYALWGAWTPILSATLDGRLHASGTDIGSVYGVLWLACIITPFIGGQLVDRYMQSQVFLGLAAAICAISAYMMSLQHEIGGLFPPHGLIPWMWIWSLAFAPTLGIANSLAFYHLGKERQNNVQDRADYGKWFRPAVVIWGLSAILLIGYVIVKSSTGTGEWTSVEKQVASVIAAFVVFGAIVPLMLNDLRRVNTQPSDEERSFSVIRTAGTIGWIVASLILTAYLFSMPKLAVGQWRPIEEMQIAAIFGALLTVLAFLLPKTPPSREVKDPWAFTKAFALFKTVPGFAVFMLISFFISTEFQFYYVLSGPFVENGLKQPHELVSLYKSIAQYAEIICLGLFTPLSLRYLGLRKTLVIGALAWPLRYFIFALQKPVFLVLASMSFHGIGFAFVFVTSYIYIDRVAPKDIRGSAQSLFTLITLGIGNYLGTEFCGRLKNHYTATIADPQNIGKTIDQVNWPMIFMVPALLTIACALAFWFTFREPRDESLAVGTAELETVSASG